MIIIEHLVYFNEIYSTREDKTMMIRDMFADDINRKINGVIKVDQAADDVIEQELNEYVITRELKKHSLHFSIITVMLLMNQPLIWVFGFQVSLEVVNLIS